MMGPVEQTYALPLDDVIQVLGASAATSAYQVRANVPVGLLPSALRRRHHYTAVVVIHAGQPASCVIWVQGSNTIVLEGAKAFETVRSRVQLVWKVRPIDSPSAQAYSTPQARETVGDLAVPSRSGWSARSPNIRELTAEQVRQITDRRQRLVWLLVDGQRTVGDLATLLQMLPSDVSEALAALTAQGLIAAPEPS